MSPNFNSRSLTDGPIGKSLFFFALPLFIGSLIQLLYNTVDLIFIGHVLGSDASAAVGSSSLIVTIILGFFTGISVGVGVIVAKAFGERNKNRINKSMHCAMGLTLLFAGIFLVVGQIFAPFFLQLLNTPTEIMNDGLTYLRIYLLSMPVIAIYDIGAGIIRSLGNSKAPMIYQLIGGLSNVLGNFILINVLGLGIPGAALATILSMTIAAMLVVVHLIRAKEYKFSFKLINIDRKMSIEIMRIGIPSAFQSIIITLSNLIIQANINSLGVDTIATFTSYFKIENFIYLPILAFGSAMSTFTSQNIGARRPDRIKRGTRTTVIMALIVTISISALIIIFYEPMFGMFNSNPTVIEYGGQIARVSYTFYFIYVFLEIYSSVIRGAGKALPTMIIMVVNMCLIRIIVLNVMTHFNPTPAGVAAVYPITWATTALSLFIYYRLGKWMPEPEKELQGNIDTVIDN